MVREKKKRNRKPPTKEQKDLKRFRELSSRHVLIVESILTNTNDILPIVKEADNLRKAGNELVGEMRKRYHELIRTKKYHGILKVYGKTKDDNEKKKLAKQMEDLQKQYNVTWDYCRAFMIPIGKKYGCASVFALTKAEDVWSGIKNACILTVKIYIFLNLKRRLVYGQNNITKTIFLR